MKISREEESIIKQFLFRIACLSLLVFLSISYVISPIDALPAESSSSTRAHIASHLFDIPLEQINDSSAGANYDYNIFGQDPSTECGYQGGHSGIDFQTKDVVGDHPDIDRTFYSVSNGTVIRAGDGDYRTISVWDEDRGISILYLHARSVDSNVFIGAEIEVGDALGIQGDAGADPGAEHVHLEVRNGRQEYASCGAFDSLNPELYIPQYLENSQTPTPQECVKPMVAAGLEHTVGLRSDGTVVAVGGNSNGQCDVQSWTGIVQVAAGLYHTVGLRSDGTVVAVGSNGNGECNVETWSDIVQVSAGFGHTVGLKSDGTVVAVGWNDNGQCNVSSWTDIVQVAAGMHTVGLKSDGTVVAVGWNDIGQCNVSSWTDIVQVAVFGYYGEASTVGLKSDGTVVSVGSNHEGLCNWTDIVQVSAGGGHTVGLKSDGTVVAVGGNSNGQCNVQSWTGIVQVAAGFDHTVGLRSDGTVVAVGWKENDQCNVQSWTGIVQVDVVNYQYSAGTVGLKADGTVVTMGSQNEGQHNVQSWTGIAQVAAGDHHTVGLKSDGTVVAVGDNSYGHSHGQCDVSSWTDIVQVAAGIYHTVGLRSDGTVVAVGSNGNGECNVETWSDIVQVAAGNYHNYYSCWFMWGWIQFGTEFTYTVGLKADGTVVAVGDNSYGQCDVSSWTDIVQVAAGGGHTVGLKSDGTVVAVGDNYHGQCNVSSWTDIVQVAAGGGHTVGLKSDGTMVAVGWNDNGQCNVSSWTGITQVAAAGFTGNLPVGYCGAVVGGHTVGLKSDGSVVAVGSNNAGQCNLFNWNLGTCNTPPPTNQSKIAYSHDSPAGNAEIYVMNADGSDQTRLTFSAGNDYDPHFSPDGSKIVFSSYRTGQCEIFVMDADGSNQVPLTSDSNLNCEPSWSPDGSKIAFVSNPYGISTIYIMNANGSNEVSLTSDSKLNRQPEWSPDGSKIAFESGRDGNPAIYVMNADGSSQIRLTSSSGADQAPCWSPDGSKIAFESDRSGNPAIYVMNADGSHQTQLTNNSSYSDYEPTWSSDGNKIAFFSFLTGGTRYENIYIIDANGQNRMQLTYGTDWSFCPSWSHSGSSSIPTPTPTPTITHVHAVFPEEIVSYNPLIYPDSVYVYYNVSYTDASEYWEKGDIVSSSESFPFHIISNDGSVNVIQCTVYSTSGEHNNYEATLQFQVPFSPNITSYVLNIGGHSVPVSIVLNAKDIEVNEHGAFYGGIGLGGIAGIKGELTILGQKIGGQAGVSLEGMIGASGGYESEISYSGVDASHDYIVFGFPIAASVEGEQTAQLGVEGKLGILLLDGSLAKESMTLSYEDSVITYPIKANLENDKYMIAAFIIPIGSNIFLPVPAILTKFASALPFDVFSPYKQIERETLAFSVEAKLLSLEISFGLRRQDAGGQVQIKGFKLPGAVFSAGVEANSIWEEGQEDGETIDTHDINVKASLTFMDFSNFDWHLLGSTQIASQKSGQIGDDSYIIENSYTPPSIIMEQRELYVNDWELNGSQFSKLYDNDGALSLSNLTKLYETGPILCTTMYQTKPQYFNMDVLELEGGAGLEGKFLIRAESETEMSFPIKTYYAANGFVYPIAEASPSLIRSNFSAIDSYAGDSLDVFIDSLKANADAAKEWLTKVALGLKVQIQSLIDNAAKKVTIIAVEGGKKIIELRNDAQEALDTLADSAFTVWEGWFNPPAAINNANLNFASRIVVINQSETASIPDGTVANIYPKDGVSLDELSDVGVYTFNNGYWTVIPSIHNPDGSFTFILRTPGIYALIHSFTDNQEFLAQTLINMVPNSSFTLTSSQIKNSDGSISKNTSFNISAVTCATISSNGSTITFGESPVSFPAFVETDGNGQLSIPITSGSLEGEAYLQIKSHSGYASQMARVIVSKNGGIEENFSVAIRMVEPSQGMAIVNQSVWLKANTSCPTDNIQWNIVDLSGHEDSYTGPDINFTPVHSGIYRVYCFATDGSGFTHTAYAELPVTDPSNDSDSDGISNDLEVYYGSDPQIPDNNELYSALEGPRPPIADAGGPYESSAGSPVTFSALASYDPDGDPLQYRWDFNNNGTWDTAWMNTPVAYHTWNHGYSGLVRLEVTDGLFVSTDTSEVAVNNIPLSNNYGGGGGDTGGSSPTAGLSVLGNSQSWSISSDGYFMEDATVSSADGSVTIFISYLTRALDSNGLPITQITVNPVTPPPAPEGMHILAAFNFEPNGATFSPGIQITIAFDPAEVAEGETVAIAFYNVATGAWDFVEGTVNPDGTASFSIDHFTVFAVLAGAANSLAPEATPTPSLTSTVSPTPTATTAQHHSHKSGGIDPVVWTGIAVGIMLTAEIIWLLFRRQK